MNSRRIKTLGNCRYWHSQERADVALRIFLNVKEEDDHSLVRWQLSYRLEHCLGQFVSFDYSLLIRMSRTNANAIVKQRGPEPSSTRETTTLRQHYAPEPT